MYLIYSILLSVVFAIMSPLFLIRREKYAAGFHERLGNYPEFQHDGRDVIWLHCVSVGETNAARPLVDAVLENFPKHRVIISTTTKTGQELAKKIFAQKADAVFYFPFDWRFSVRRALRHFRPSVVLLMETEIWPRFIHEAKRAGAKVAIVNGRLSERSFSRYAKVRPFISRVLSGVDAALMQGPGDANRLISLELSAAKAMVTGNLKFDVADDERDAATASELDERFHFSGERPVIVAASTHEPEERWVLDAFCSVLVGDAAIKPRLVIAPRHPERFDDVYRLIESFGNGDSCEYKNYKFVRRSDHPGELDKDADIVLLDSIGELRALYRLSEITFTGGSLIPHGGQSILEPAAAGNAVITGPHTFNFADVVKVFVNHQAIIQLPELDDRAIPDELFTAMCDLLEHDDRRSEQIRNARSVMDVNRGATEKTVAELHKIIEAN